MHAPRATQLLCLFLINLKTALIYCGVTVTVAVTLIDDCDIGNMYIFSYLKYSSCLQEILRRGSMRDTYSSVGQLMVLISDNISVADDDNLMLPCTVSNVLPS